MKGTKLFLTSWPHGSLQVVDVIEKHPTIKGGWYIRYETGGTDTTTKEFLFDIPSSLLVSNAKLSRRVAVGSNAELGLGDNGDKV